ncbi:hypothetical protein RRG08_031050 [Elysia crispata]|uniref:Uncharacterized protein n=1 Tax=Elysia crispata TaxID=231223 RepID=A0AAE1DF51_9GAST|nr:hypothetical protein RRG08_031050 [Elysia crispata]
MTLRLKRRASKFFAGDLTKRVTALEWPGVAASRLPDQTECPTRGWFTELPPTPPQAVAVREPRPPVFQRAGAEPVSVNFGPFY